MTPSDQKLLDAATEAAHHSYSPYSHFPVGAALLLDNGRVVTGCNVENAAFGSTICAERSAVTRAIISRPCPDNETQRPNIKAVAIVGLKSEPCYPCGSCRQVLREFNCERVIVSQNNAPFSVDFADILPLSFGPSSLKK